MKKDFYQADVSLRDLRSFILKHHGDDPTKWDHEGLEPWIEFHQREGFLIATSNDGLTISGLVMARPILNPMDAFDHFAFDQEGPIIYVDLAIAVERDALRGLVIALVHRFGLRESVAWHRRNANKLIVRPAFIVIQKLLRKEKVAP